MRELKGPLGEPDDLRAPGAREHSELPDVPYRRNDEPEQEALFYIERRDEDGCVVGRRRQPRRPEGAEPWAKSQSGGSHVTVDRHNRLLRGGEPLDVSHTPLPSSPKLVSLLDQRDHLRILISLAADEAVVDVAMVTKLSMLLEEIELAISHERTKSDA